MYFMISTYIILYPYLINIVNHYIVNLFSNIISPLDQFEVRNLLSLEAPILGNLSISLTNIGLCLTIVGYFIFIILLSLNMVDIEEARLNHDSLRRQLNENNRRDMVNFITVRGIHRNQSGYFVFEAANLVHFSEPIVWKLKTRSGVNTEFIYKGLAYKATFYNRNISRIEPHIYVPVRLRELTLLKNNYLVFSGGELLEVVRGFAEPRMKVLIQ